MVKFPEAAARLFKNMFVCRRCNTKRRVPNRKVLAGQAICRKCQYKILRPVRKK